MILVRDADDDEKKGENNNGAWGFFNTRSVYHHIYDDGIVIKSYLYYT